ncbi:hypothetical protein GCM10007049_30950 [Echinicola pacifica]|uniref:Uncharacterized protein n=1 Tax=Echinicola pacifica TaxID=346377 RepID=A0A918Q8B8_9BACT|nr:hypothetical protein [Echinicola pacifica]GGZ35337.1 hypothetical protein GCM10007049_30950 [Echinicola pacifica]
MKNNHTYIEFCKKLYLEGFTPANIRFREHPKFEEFLRIVKQEVYETSYEMFYEYTKEHNYFTNLWTSHLLIEYFKVSKEIKSSCLEIIVRYSEGRLNPKVAREERDWLEMNRLLYV